jgi:hypothetical protein
MADRPKLNSESAKELEKVQVQFDKFDDNVKSLTDVNLSAPIADFEPQTKMSTREATRHEAEYIKPARTIGSKEPFNEKFRAESEQAKKYVRCIAENREIIGERCEFWTKPFPGYPAEFWQLPVNKPICVPGYVAKRLSECSYSRMTMDDSKTVSSDGMGTYYGTMVVKDRIQRLDARSVGNSFVAMGS